MSLGDDADVLVLKGARRCGRSVLAGLLLRGNDGLQVLALPPLLPAVAVGCLRDLLRLVDGRLLDIGAIHIGLPRHALGCRWALKRVVGCVCGQALRSRPAGLIGVRADILSERCTGWGHAQSGCCCTALRFLQLLDAGLSAAFVGPVHLGLLIGAAAGCLHRCDALRRDGSLASEMGELSRAGCRRFVIWVTDSCDGLRRVNGLDFGTSGKNR